MDNPEAPKIDQDSNKPVEELLSPDEVASKQMQIINRILGILPGDVVGPADTPPPDPEPFHPPEIQ